uniref:DUF423-domain-containing protein n=1 Tax=Vannella robusta TaxID=1487602 RepID=A0A7S4HJI3_9EUKA|mmetsp:Transcript_11543/g.14318  ORF Transcript_11543/g.14318 Transcript_11543/m.14318 type:complete len:119 (+) Transcript_11543:93-449(+)
MDRYFWLRLGAISGAISVAMGAFGAHGLKKRYSNNPQKVASWNTAAHYQLIHSVVLCLLSFTPRTSPLTGYLLSTGITLFSGSIYLLVLTEWKLLGPVTPIGGLCLIASWISLAINNS